MKTSLRISLIFFFVSIIALLTQVVYLRQVLLLFEQSEYIISIFLFLWLSSNGLGIVLGQKNKINIKKLFHQIQIYGLTAIVFYAVLLLTRPELLGIKTNLNLILGILYASGSIIIVSGFNGWVFAQFAHQSDDNQNVMWLYKIETIAFVLAGIIATVIVFYFSAFWILVGSIILMQLYINFFQFSLWNSAVLLLTIFLVVLMPTLESSGYDPIFPNSDFLGSYTTPSGEIDLLVQNNTNDTLMLFQGTPAFSAKPPAAPEEAAFPAMAQGITQPKILISGSDIVTLLNGLSETDFQSIHILFKDKHYFNVLKKYLPERTQAILNNKKVDVIHRTLQEHLQTNSQYDIIFINEPRPALMENALVFFPKNIHLLRSSLETDGCLSMLFSPESAYAGRINQNLKGSILSTTKSIFKHATIMALDNYTVLLAANRPLVTDYTEMEQNLAKLNIYPSYFNSFHVGSRLMNQEAIGMNKIKTYETALSFDQPLVYLAGLLQMFEQYSVNLTHKFMKFGEKVYRHNRSWQIVTLILLTLLFLLFANRKPGYAVVFQGGFAGIAAQTMFIYLYQLHFGQIYLMIGLMISVFMVGLLAGLYFRWKLNISRFSAMSLALIILLLGCSTVFGSQILIFLGVLLSGSYTGFLFNWATNRKKIPGLQLYVSDLLGAVTGNILIPLLIIPLLGFYTPIALLFTFGVIAFWGMHTKKLKV